MTTTKNKSFWGKGIWLAYGSFVVFILAMVAFAAYQHFDLVESDYYEKGLQYQKQIDKSNRTTQQQKQPILSYSFDPLQVSLCFPTSEALQPVTGTILFFRPSAAAYDIKDSLKLNEQECQIVQDKRLIPGNWRVKIDWEENGQSYYYETQLLIEKSGIY